MLHVWGTIPINWRHCSSLEIWQTSSGSRTTLLYLHQTENKTYPQNTYNDLDPSLLSCLYNCIVAVDTLSRPLNHSVKHLFSACSKTKWQAELQNLACYLYFFTLL